MQQKIYYNSPFGPLCIVYDELHITSIKRVKGAFEFQAPPGKLLKMVFCQLDEYFAGKRQNFDFAYKAHGTEFQKKVWQALCNIPYGKTCSYKDIALAIGNPKASRAVGLANNKNPISIVIPCHRVIASNGKLAGYAGGIEMKQALLDMERGKKLLV